MYSLQDRTERKASPISVLTLLPYSVACTSRYSRNFFQKIVAEGWDP